MDKDKALKLALEVLEQLQGGCTDHDDGTVEAITVWCPEVISAIEEALAQPAQEPVAWLCKADKHGLFGLPTADKACKDCFPVYAAPPQRPWVGLTNDDIFAAVKDLYGSDESAFMGRIDDIATARAIEAKLKEKNA